MSSASINACGAVSVPKSNGAGASGLSGSGCASSGKRVFGNCNRTRGSPAAPTTTGSVSGISSSDSRSITSATTTVTLSGAPRSSARSTRRVTTPVGSPELSEYAISMSLKTPDNPSEHNRNRSPLRASRTERSGSTGFIPSNARIRSERRGCTAASASVIRPESTSVCTYVWSWVSCCKSPSRSR